MKGDQELLEQIILESEKLKYLVYTEGISSETTISQSQKLDILILQFQHNSKGVQQHEKE